jgi:hypothetical protein
MPAKKEQAIVKPPAGGKMRFKQSRFEHLASVPFRVIAAGRSGSGKTSALYSAVTDHYRGCFTEIRICARTAFLDHSYVQLREWAERTLKQDQKEKPFVFTELSEEKLMPLFDEWAARVAKEKVQRKADHSKEPLSCCLWIIDDLSDSPALRQRGESVLNKLATTGRHSGQSVWVNVHALSAVSPLIRKNASMLLIFKISNNKEFEMLREEYAHLVGKTEFDEIYATAVGKGAPAYSFLTILPHEADERKMFLARMDQRLFVEDSEDEDIAPQPVLRK